jgi:hypothetical protein
MIQANDLRIGNYIEKSLKSGQGRKLIGKIGCQDIVRISENTGSFNYDPILLTEEILLKCGFKKQDYNMSNCHVYQKGSYRVLKSFNDNNINQDYSLCINGISPPTWSIAHFKYVHQFQNLYFALTNTELEINL